MIMSFSKVMSDEAINEAASKLMYLLDSPMSTGEEG